MYTAHFMDHAHENLAYDLGADQFIGKSGHTQEILNAVEVYVTPYNVFNVNNN